MKQLEIISPGPYRCGETPMWDDAAKALIWSDMLAGVLWSYSPGDGRVRQIGQGKNAAGLALRRDGGLVCACHQGVYLWDEARGFTLVADSFEGEALRCNDATADAAGRFLFGTTFCVSTDPVYPLGKLYSMQKDGSIEVLDEGIHLSNGLGFSPDGRTLYYTDTVPRLIYAYDYDVATGRASNRRVFVKIPADEGIPDGMTVDAQGYVWSAQWYGSCIVRYDPDGRVERRIPFPVRQVSSLMFGGEGFTDIYVTTAGDTAVLSCAPKGYDFGAPNTGGPIYRLNLGIPGRREHLADIRPV